MELTTTTETKMIINLDVTYNTTTTQFEATIREDALDYFITNSDIDGFAEQVIDLADIHDITVSSVIVHQV
jgi:hypothetical protein